MQLNDILFATVCIGASAVFLLLLAEKLRDRFRPAAAATSPTSLPPLAVKQVLAVKPEAVDDLVRANPYLRTVEDCRLMISGMQDYETQERRLFHLLGWAVVRQPGMAYVVRMGER